MSAQAFQKAGDRRGRAQIAAALAEIQMLGGRRLQAILGKGGKIKVAGLLLARGFLYVFLPLTKLRPNFGQNTQCRLISGCAVDT